MPETIHWSPDESFLALGQQQLRVYDAERGALLFRAEHDPSLYDLNGAPLFWPEDPKEWRLATARAWLLAVLEERASVPGRERPRPALIRQWLGVRQAAATSTSDARQGRFVLVGPSDRHGLQAEPLTLTLVEAETGQRIAAWECRGRVVARTAHEHLLVAFSEAETYVVDPAKRECIAFSLSAEGNSLVERTAAPAPFT